MHLKTLRLTEFRRYRSLELEIPTEGFVLIGRNASGKSSLLEAVAMLSTMRSSRAQSERELIAWDSGSEYGGEVAPFARIEATVERKAGPAEIAVGIQLDPQRGNHLRKQISLNGKHVRAGTAVGVLDLSSSNREISSWFRARRLCDGAISTSCFRNSILSISARSADTSESSNNAIA